MLFLLSTYSITAVLIIALVALLAIAAYLFYTYSTQKYEALHAKKEKLNAEMQNFISQIDELQSKLLQRESEAEYLSKQIASQLEEQERLKASLSQARMIAEEADMLKSNFLANMSHEIRTPMNGILGFATLMQTEDMNSEKYHRYLDIICHNGNMLINLIDDIMDVSKIEAGQMALSKIKVNLDDLMFDLYTFFNEVKFKQEKEHITIRLLNLNDDENNIFYTDGLRIRQIISNLVGNALKFTEKGFVEFGYINDTQERHIKFFVRDTGIGIPPDKLGIIFERFRQVQEGSTRKYGGTGIGLYISKHIVNLLGGKIWVESRLNSGTSFYFTIPYESMQQDKDASIFQPVKKNYSWNDKVIVIAEDIETNYYYLSAILAETKAKLLWARDGQEAVNFCSTNEKVDLVLMDIQMPKLNGYDATSKIKEINPGIRVIAQTAYAMPNDNIKCLEAGCDDYISKPVSSALLLQKIDSHFTGQAYTNR